jgi:hypothetical protein
MQAKEEEQGQQQRNRKYLGAPFCKRDSRAQLWIWVQLNEWQNEVWTMELEETD